MGIKRYSYENVSNTHISDWTLIESIDGDWVAYEDHVNETKEQEDFIVDQSKQISRMAFEIEKLTMEVNFLKSQIWKVSGHVSRHESEWFDDILSEIDNYERRMYP
jgi:hypothetical protein